jgi:hypothetical protein
VIRYPDGWEAQAERIKTWFPRSRHAAAAWLGVAAKGEPRLFLVRDHDGMPSSGKLTVPEWAAAVCFSDDRIYFRLDLVDTRPAKKLELVLDHELVHQILNHLGGPRLPRWFEEGLCVSYAGLPYLEMNVTLERAAAAGALPTLEETRMLFTGNATEAAKAYEIGHRAVRHLLARHGPESMRGILRRVSQGTPFDEAFAQATGRSVDAFEAEWRAEVTPVLPFWLYVIVADFGLALLWFGAVLVFIGWLRRRLRRERAMASLEGGGWSGDSF